MSFPPPGKQQQQPWKKNTLTDVDLRMKPYNRWNAVAGHSILEVKFEI